MKKKKPLILALALVLLVVGVVGGTIAYLMDTTATLTNIFEVAKIRLELTESGTTDNARSYVMVPGQTLPKDPKVTVKGLSQKCYVFVEIQKVNNPDAWLDYTVNTGTDKWTQLDDQNVYYMIADTTLLNHDLPDILVGNQVTVKDTVTEDQLEALTAETYPKLNFTAYAVQYNKSEGVHFEPAEAWEQAKLAD